MNRAAGVILAAGGSKRIGHPKQLLDWFGKTFIQQIVETAFASKLNPIIVITGAYSEEVESNISKYDLIVVKNVNWEEGLSSSIILGVETARILLVNSIVFLLCDKPQVPTSLVNQIIEVSKNQDVDLVTTSVGNVTCPPVLFKSICFDELLKLSGDEGGRGIIKKFRCVEVNCADERINYACDTESEYKELLQSYKK